MENSKYPIGLFDSGIGGTSIWKEIHSLLPNEDTIYLADSKNAPYGQRSKDEILDLSIKNVEFLLDKNCKIIVVACNTATTNAIKELRAKYSKIPFIGIEPAIKPAATSTKTQTIGILATKGTLNSDLFHSTVSNFKDIRVIEQVGHGLVRLIEDGHMDSRETESLLRSYLEPMVEAGIDYLVLGCSHYPYLVPQIKKILPNHINIIDSGEAVARQTKNILQSKNLLNMSGKEGEAVFYINNDPTVLTKILKAKHKVITADF
ncbi:glutamate racemase [Flavobacterium cyanobacteriorum]|uniref:Glutamate racemase n=1 Tax=Flavobacterium cyanobacteriorum TaxID=2022802 RepID=A0A255Z7C2_9FLAO|nr:glutamate racemase [Flavobacterium cyanobacteriorum]OYQ37447.1 glutamate racemase [Flavobacterium cyanobacteriorum]